MASTTPNIGLTLPTGAEKVSRQIINDNNTLIDGKMGAVPVGQNLQGEIDALNSKIRSKEFTPNSNDSLLTWLLANVNRDTLPFSFVKVGNNQMSDVPSFGTGEFSGVCDGNGDRLTVELIRYGAGNNIIKLVRTIFQNNWLGNWQQLSISSDRNSLTSENANVTINNGGYISFGPIVVVCMKITFSANVAESAKILSGFPVTSGGISLPMMSIGKTYSLRLSGDSAYLNQASASGEYWITGAYLVY